MRKAESKVRAKGMRMETETILKAADQFQSASSKTYSILQELSKTVKELQQNWQDPNQEQFFLLYQELETQMKTSALVLDRIAYELKQAVERLEKADK